MQADHLIANLNKSSGENAVHYEHNQFSDMSEDELAQHTGHVAKGNALSVKNAAGWRDDCATGASNGEVCEWFWTDESFWKNTQEFYYCPWVNGRGYTCDDWTVEQKVFEWFYFTAYEYYRGTDITDWFHVDAGFWDEEGWEYYCPYGYYSRQNGDDLCGWWWPSTAVPALQWYYGCVYAEDHFNQTQSIFCDYFKVESSFWCDQIEEYLCLET